MRHKIGSLLVRREQNQVSQTFDNHGRDLDQISVSALDALLHELVDVTMQAVGHRSSWSLTRPDGLTQPAMLLMLVPSLTWVAAAFVLCMLKSYKSDSFAPPHSLLLCA